MTRDPNSSQTVEKAIQILRAIGSTEGPLSVGAVAQETGFSPTAVRRIVRALEKAGAVSRPDGVHLQIGWMIRGLSTGAEWHDLLKHVAAPTMMGLRRGCGGETVGLYVAINSTEFICIEALSGLHDLIHVERKYRPIPMDKGATSRIFLVQRLRRYGEAALLDFLVELGEGTQAPSIVRDVKRAARQGYAQSKSTRFAGMTGISAPIETARGEPIAAITISGASERFRPKELPQWIEQCKGAASHIQSRFLTEAGAANIHPTTN